MLAFYLMNGYIIWTHVCMDFAGNSSFTVTLRYGRLVLWNATWWCDMYMLYLQQVMVTFFCCAVHIYYYDEKGMAVEITKPLYCVKCCQIQYLWKLDVATYFIAPVCMMNNSHLLQNSFTDLRGHIDSGKWMLSWNTLVAFSKVYLSPSSFKTPTGRSEKAHVNVEILVGHIYLTVVHCTLIAKRSGQL